MKIDKSFPRKYLESNSCGDGFYESTGRGHYEHPGVDAEAVIGSEVRIIEIMIAHTIFYDLFESVFAIRKLFACYQRTYIASQCGKSIIILTLHILAAHLTV